MKTLYAVFDLKGIQLTVGCTDQEVVQKWLATKTNTLPVGCEIKVIKDDGLSSFSTERVHFM